MALGGGSFTSANKVLPGAYINFVSKARALGSLGTRGTVALGLELGWGPSEVITIEAEEFQKETLSLLGYSYFDEVMKPLREVFKNAKTLKLYRLNADGGSNATTTLGTLTITAKYPGTRGNDIKIVVQPSIDNENNNDVITYVGNLKVDEQTVASVEELKSNSFVSFSGTGTLEPTAGKNLAGGTDGTVTGESYVTFLDKVESENFNVVAYAGSDDLTKSLISAFIKRLRDAEGYKVQAVLYDYPGADHEGVISVKNNCELVYWVAGATAGAEINQSLTNRIYTGEYIVNTKYKPSEFEKAIKNGEFAFYQDGDVVRVLTDINTFTSFEPSKNEDFSSNRVIRVLDQIANDVARIFGDYYLGKVSNDSMGRTLFKNELVKYHEQLQNSQAIEEFIADDIEVLQGSGKRDVIINEAVKPTDSMEKLYMSVEIQ